MNVNIHHMPNNALEDIAVMVHTVRPLFLFLFMRFVVGHFSNIQLSLTLIPAWISKYMYYKVWD